jgi:hypothetical protein
MTIRGLTPGTKRCRRLPDDAVGEMGGAVGLAEGHLFPSTLSVPVDPLWKLLEEPATAPGA